ncbi:hypothetical protein D9757_000434 [Collybiopsis confluens]|uniref:Uncharacterized protein n=1 Tax=Collybiopsis confluens TaxID=2823264 RepID=A0A8H5MHU4_9AGAR|nr:hypothetical protein D9757_000434 [Collybiopsis confluens]
MIYLSPTSAASKRRNHCLKGVDFVSPKQNGKVHSYGFDAREHWYGCFLFCFGFGLMRDWHDVNVGINTTDCILDVNVVGASSDVVSNLRSILFDWLSGVTSIAVSPPHVNCIRHAQTNQSPNSAPSIHRIWRFIWLASVGRYRFSIAEYAWYPVAIFILIKLGNSPLIELR